VSKRKNTPGYRSKKKNFRDFFLVAAEGGTAKTLETPRKQAKTTDSEEIYPPILAKSSIY